MGIPGHSHIWCSHCRCSALQGLCSVARTVLLHLSGLRGCVHALLSSAALLLLWTLRRYHGLAGWQLDAENAREITGSYSPGDDAQGHPLAKADPGGAFLSTTSPTTSPRRQSGQTRASLRGVTRKMLQGAKVAFAFDRTSTVRPVMLQCLPPGMQLLFLQPKHPLAGLRE
ncbi:unnamed protein product, partial [Prorocentrum cordatum]